MTDGTKSPLFIQIDIEAIEDLHTGSGTGSGDIDALVQRDRHGHPVIRASHFKGLLREACEELISYGATSKDELNALLGTSGKNRGALRMTSMQWREGGATLTWGSAKRVEGGRTPEQEDTLRFIEHTAAGTRFQATLRLADNKLYPLLERLLRRIDRIGGDRNRGSGLVKLTWDACELVPRNPLRNVSGTCLRLVLRNLDPLCLPATGYPGNLIRSHSFIRGQTLHGALMAWAIHTGRSANLALFDHVSIGDALPLPDGTANVDTVLPMPLSILTEKPKGVAVNIPWWAGGATTAVTYDSLAEERIPDEKHKRPGAHEYLSRSDENGPWLRYTPTMKVRLRNATPKKSSQKDAKLFSLEEIAEDTRFQADLYFVNDAAARNFIDAFAPLLYGGDWLTIGRGGQPAIVESITAPPEMTQETSADDWTLTLVSDLVVHGEHLGFLDNLDEDHLAALAGTEKKDGWKIVKAVVEVEPIHGFNATSGLPRAPVLALRRGSCWRITGTGSAVFATKLAEKKALGERTCEGLGRFLINAQPIAELDSPQLGKAGPQINQSEALLSQALDLSRQIKNDGPSLSQLQWLRVRALAATDISQLDTLLEEIESAPRRRPQGGKAWDAFPTQKLKETLIQLSNPDKNRELIEKRQLISHLVQRRAQKEKENRG